MAAETVEVRRTAPERSASRSMGRHHRRLVVAGRLKTLDAAGFFETFGSLDPRPGLVALNLRHMTFTTLPEVDAGEMRLALAGELDLATAPIFESALAFALGTQPASLVIDLRDLVFIDGRRATDLAGAAQAMAAWGGVLQIRSPRRSVARVLALCSRDQPLRISGAMSSTARRARSEESLARTPRGPSPPLPSAA